MFYWLFWNVLDRIEFYLFYILCSNLFYLWVLIVLNEKENLFYLFILNVIFLVFVSWEIKYVDYGFKIILVFIY